MEENISTTQTDLFNDNRQEALPNNPEWPSLPASQRTNETSHPASSITLGQKLPGSPETPVFLAVKKRPPQDYERDGVKKYAQYFQGDEILPIPELVAEVEPKTESFIITDLKTRRLAEVKKETFEELLKSVKLHHLRCPSVLRRAGS